MTLRRTHLIGPPPLHNIRCIGRWRHLAEAAEMNSEKNVSSILAVLRLM